MATTGIPTSIFGGAERDFTSQVSRSNLGKDDFLKLLVTQLQYQDPLNPMEDQQFIAQLAQFSSLEQLNNIADSIDKLTEAGARQELIAATSYIGKEIRADGYGISKAGNSVSQVYFELTDNISSGYLNIFNTSGELIRTDMLPASSKGEYWYNWDGKDYKGEDMADGVYYVFMAGQDENGAAVMINTEVSGRVVGVQSDNGTQYLRLADNRTVRLLDVKEVIEAGKLPGSEDTNNNNNNNTTNPDPNPTDPNPTDPEPSDT